MNKLRFGLVGCGRISRKHAEAIKALERADLAAVCDIQPERAAKLGKEFAVPFYQDYKEMLKKESIDVVNILTPSGMHANHTIEIINNFRKHIVCEKPMALTLVDADKMIEAAAANHVKLFVVKQNRYNLPVMKLKEAIDAGRFGKMVLGTVRVRWMREQKYYDQDAWRGTWALDGGVYSNQAAHHVDLLEWLMGEPEEVFSLTATRLAKIEVEDTAVATLRFRNGALGVIEATTAARPKDLEGSLSILGERGTVVIGGFAVNKIQTWQFIDQLAEDNAVVERYGENPPNVYGFGHVRYLKDVCDSILDNLPVPVDGKEGKKSLKLIIAMYESAERQRPIKLSEVSGRCKLGGAANA